MMAPMLICVPNMQHWSFADRLLRGTWKYEPDGLLDETHLRWFSLETMREGLEAIGLVPHEVSPRVFDAASAQEFAGMIAPALTRLGVDPAAYAQRATPLQYVWRVLKRPRQLISVAANMLEPVGGVSHVRVVYPLQAMRSDPTVLTRFVTSGEINVPAGDMPRIFVLHRPTLAGDRGAAVIRKLLADGWVVVTEFDDHPDHFGMLDADDELAFRGVHAVQTSTPALAAILRTRNPEVMVFPNMIRVLPEVRNFLDPQVMTLFFGALNRERDWAPLIPVLNEVAEKAGGRLRFRVVHDQGFFDALRTPHKQFTPTCDYDTYLALLGQCEISSDAAGGHAVQSRQVGSQVHRGRRLPGGVAGEPHRVWRQHRGRPHRTAVPQRRANCATGCCAWWRCRNWRAGWAMRRGTTSPASACWRTRWRRASRGIARSVGAAGGTEQRAARAAYGDAALARRRIGGGGGSNAMTFDTATLELLHGTKEVRIRASGTRGAL